MKKTSKLRRSQIDRKIKKIKYLNNLKTPKDGWIREIRTALSMSMVDLAARMGVIKQRVERLEHAEIEGKVTLESMHRVAEALGCDFVYALIPKQPLQKFYEEQAATVAAQLTRAVDQTMTLELQQTSADARRNLIEAIKQDLIAKEDRRIWRLK